MYKNIKVEAENLELIIENSHGDKVIIPANKRNWVKQKLSDGCHGCIDGLVETLPVASQYAEDGSIIPQSQYKPTRAKDENIHYYAAQDKVSFYDKAVSGLVLPFMEDVIKEGGPGEGEDPQHSILKTPIKGMKEELFNKLYDDINAKKAYVNSDAFARRALEFAPDKIKNDPKKAANWLADRRQEVYYNLNPKISVEPTPFNAAGEWDRQGRRLLIDPEYVKYSQEISRHEDQHMTHATFLEEPKFDKMVASQVRDRKNLDINTPEGERLSKLNTANYYATAIDEISAYTGTLRQYLEESFNLSPGDAITKEHYDKFINIIKSDPDKYRFLNSQLKNLKVLLAPEGEQSDNFITEFMNKLVSNEKPKSTSNNKIQTAQYGRLIRDINYAQDLKIAQESTNIVKAFDLGKATQPKKAGVIQSITNNIPISVRQFMYDTLGGVGGIDESHLSDAQYKSLQDAVRYSIKNKQSKNGNYYINYNTWRGVGSGGIDVTKDDMNLLNSASDLSKFLGQANIRIHPNGSVFVEDIYNFNNAADKNKNPKDVTRGWLPLDESTSLSNKVYRAARNFKTLTGSSEGGSKSFIYVGNKKDFGL